MRRHLMTALVELIGFSAILAAANAQSVPVEGQPLASNVGRVLQALDTLGAPVPANLRTALAAALKAQDSAKIQALLDPRVLVVVDISPEARVKAKRGPATADLQQTG